MNYPDDISQYDCSPSSPFYHGGMECHYCGTDMNEFDYSLVKGDVIYICDECSNSRNSND